MTLRTLLEQAAEAYAPRVALRFKAGDAWQTRTYAELLARVRRTAAFLGGLGLQPGDRVALFLPNCPEWPEIYLGITGLGLVAVPMDAKLRAQEIGFILRDSGARVLFCSAAALPFLPDLRAQSPDLASVVLLDPAPPPAGCLGYDQAVAAAPATGAYADARPHQDDLAALLYTSGTTGQAKGTMLTHGNFTSNVTAIRAVIAIYPEDNFLLVLPLHHTLALTANLLVPLASGSAISFIESLKSFSDDLRATQPTALIGVPLLFEKMYRRVLENLQARLPGRLLLKLGLLGLVRRRVLARFGGKLRIMITGGAPCDAELLRAFTHLGLPLLEGYGLTETAPVLTLNPLEQPRPGSVGQPVPGITLRLFDATAEGVGEIAARGPNVMRGYYGQPDATASAFREGWFLTGDLGRFDAEGYLTITGRKKCLIVNREGKNINPEEVEAQALKSPLIQEALVLGYRESGEHVGEHVGLIVVPRDDALSAPNAEQRIRTDLKRVLHAIADYKHPRRIVIRREEFEKTSTGKIKRFHYTMPEHGEF
jgi:long-chain acyl-CoA synthetase